MPPKTPHLEHLVSLYPVNDTSFPLDLLTLPCAKWFWNIVGTTLYLWRFFRVGVEVRRQEYNRKKARTVESALGRNPL